MKTALLLIAHGSRRAEANADLDYVANEIRATGRFDYVQTSYLELAEPNIQRGGELCVEHGAELVVMLPYFLSPGVHVMEDLTEERNRLAVRFPFVMIRLAEPLGRHLKIIDVVMDRAENVVDI